MAVIVAEYLGQRVDITNPVVIPVSKNVKADCPFANIKCPKHPRYKPICSVRKTGSEGTLWIVCEHRLCSTKKTERLAEHQQSILRQIARTIYASNIRDENILVKREVSIPVTADTRYSADYVMRQKNPPSDSADKVILEMQGGGETTNTGTLTQEIQLWENEKNRTNDMLTLGNNSAGTLETNAWRRQQEQFLTKGNVAFQTGGRIVFCVGSLLYDYLYSRVEKYPLVDLRDDYWSLALISFKEDLSHDVKPGSIPLIIDESKMLFTNYPSFIQILTNQGIPSKSVFTGKFINLEGEQVDV